MADAQIVLILRELYPFRNLSDDDVAKLNALSTLVKLGKDESMRVEGTEETPFYMLISGRAELAEIGPDKKPGKAESIRPGEFFGADLQLFRKVRTFEVKGRNACQFIRLDTAALTQVVREVPGLRQGLLDMLEMEKELHGSHLKWLDENEQVRMMVRQNPTFLLVAILRPALAFLFSITFLSIGLAVESQGLRFAILAIMGLLSLVTFAWLLWSYIDWSNDYYIVTDQRAVWLEQVIGLYESRREVMLSAIKTSEVKTSQLGRILGYGEMTVYAFMGQLHFRNISHPEQAKSLIDRLQKQAAQKIQKEDTQAMERIIRRKIDPPPQAPPKPAAPAPAKAGPARRLPTWKEITQFFSLELRIEDGDTITYRKHWLLLFAKLWLPITLQIGTLVLTGWLVVAHQNGTLSFPSPIASILLGLFLSLFAIGGWLYIFIDWRNDIYQVTGDRLIDSERKPLGDEVTRSAPLGNVQNMDYQRIGLIGIIFNFGTVTINTGADSKLTFDYIYDPARAQQEIFNRLYSMQRKKQLSEATRQWEQVSDWLAAYHRQAEDLRMSKKTE